MKNVALIFAGGIGSRMGSKMPKQFLTWNGKAILIHTLNVFEHHPRIDEIYVACKKEWIDYARKLIEQEPIHKVVSITAGGETALDSQLYALREIKRVHPREEIAVLIHDGVRPLVDNETIEKNIDAVWKYGNAITVTDTIETVITINSSGSVKDVLDRGCCRMAKAPQSFMLNDILRAHDRALAEGKHDYIDSASLMTHYGYDLHTVAGTIENIKVTTPADFYMYLGIVKSKGETDAGQQ